MNERSQPAHLTETCHIFNRVKELRQSSGLSQKDLAKELGLNHRTVGYIERQDYEPSLRMAWRAADYFNVPLEDVVYRDEHPTRTQQSSLADQDEINNPSMVQCPYCQQLNPVGYVGCAGCGMPPPS